jgi:tetratricopeptide (TPR) repeat protein
VEELRSRPLQSVEPTQAERLREEIGMRLAERDGEGAIEAYQRLMRLDRGQVLSSAHQIEVANYLAQGRMHAEAADAYEAFLDAYPGAADAPQVRLFLGLICSRYLGQDERAITHLRAAAEALPPSAQRDLAEEALREAEHRVRERSGR